MQKKNNEKKELLKLIIENQFQIELLKEKIIKTRYFTKISTITAMVFSYYIVLLAVEADKALQYLTLIILIIMFSLIARENRNN